MKEKRKYLRFLLILIPILPAFILMNVAGFQFSVFLCFCMALLIGLFCLLSLFDSPAVAFLRKLLTCLVILAILAAGSTEAYIVSQSVASAISQHYIIVLGAGVNGRRPSLMLQDRIDAAYSYLISHPDAVCIASGGQGTHEDISEAACIFAQLTAMGIEPERIWQEDQSTNTWENIRNSAALIHKKTGSEPESVGIVSNEFHLCRAKYIARKQGVQPAGIPAPTSWVSLKVNYYLREIPALWCSILFGGN